MLIYNIVLTVLFLCLLVFQIYTSSNLKLLSKKSEIVTKEVWEHGKRLDAAEKKIRTIANKRWS